MIALLRYLYLKNLREGWIAGMLAGPALLLVAPAVIFFGKAALNGTLTFPIQVDGNTAAGLEGIGIALAFAIAGGACAGGFVSFAREASSGALGSIMLATRPHKVVVSAWAFNVVLSVLGVVIANVFAKVAALAMTGWAPAMFMSDPGSGVAPHMFAIQLLVIFGASTAAGLAMVSVSPVPTMLIPAWAVTVATFMWQYEKSGAVSVVLGIVETAVLIAAAAWLMRRRCAA